jgi:hypothetical protein
MERRKEKNRTRNKGTERNMKEIREERRRRRKKEEERKRKGKERKKRRGIVTDFHHRP